MEEPNWLDGESLFDCGLLGTKITELDGVVVKMDVEIVGVWQFSEASELSVSLLQVASCTAFNVCF